MASKLYFLFVLSLVLVHATSRNVPSGDDDQKQVIVDGKVAPDNVGKGVKDKKCIVGGFAAVGGVAGVGAVVPLVGGLGGLGGAGGLGGLGGAGGGGLGGLGTGGLGGLGGGIGKVGGIGGGGILP